VCDLSVQHAIRVRRIKLSSVASPAIRFYTSSHKRHGFRKHVIEHKIMTFSTTFAWIISHSKNCEIWSKTGLRAKWPLLLSDFNETWIKDIFSKKNQISHFIQISPVGTELFHAHRRTRRGYMSLLAILRTHPIKLAMITTKQPNGWCLLAVSQPRRKKLNDAIKSHYIKVFSVQPCNSVIQVGISLKIWV